MRSRAPNEKILSVLKGRQPQRKYSISRPRHCLLYNRNQRRGLKAITEAKAKSWPMRQRRIDEHFTVTQAQTKLPDRNLEKKYEI